VNAIWGTPAPGDDSGAREVLGDALSSALAGDVDEAATPRVADAGRAGLVVATRTDDGVLVLEGELLPPLPMVEAREARVDALLALARIGETLAELHARDRVCGDVRPETVRFDGGLASLVLLRSRVDPGPLLDARLQAGHGPRAVAFAAPELVEGHSAGAAADVYGLAATTAWAVTGRLPVGQLRLGLALGPVDGAALRTWMAALDPDEAARPDAAALASALRSLALSLRDGADAEPAPGPASRSVGARPSRRAADSSVLLQIILIIGAVFVFIGVLWFAAIFWGAFGDVGRLVLLLAFTAALAGASKLAFRAEYLRTGHALLVLSTQVLWGDAALVLEVLDLENSSGAWSVAATLVSIATLAVALARRSALLSVLSTIGFSIAGLTLGDALSTGSKIGPSAWCLLMGGGFGALAAGLRRAGPAKVAAPHVVAVAFWLLIACALTLELVDRKRSLAELFGNGWGVWALVVPYAVLAVVATLAARAKDNWRVLWMLALLPLTLTPTVHALMLHDDRAALVVASGLGLLALAAGWLLPALQEPEGRRWTSALAGLCNLCIAPALVAIETSKRNFADGDLFANALVIGTAAGLVALGNRYEHDDAPVALYRIVEGAGAALFLGVYSLLSLVHHRDLGYPALLFCGGAMLLGIGFIGRRVTLVLFAGIALILNAWAQYFLQLKDDVPISLLTIGFGLGLLVLGWLYERRIKKLLPTLRTWS
jgi:hypothetical protein